MTFRIRKIAPPVILPRDLMTPEVHEIVNMLSKAFSADPFILASTGYKINSKELQLAVQLNCGCSTVGGLIGGEVYVAETLGAVPKIVGCAIWRAPGRKVDDSPDEEMAKSPYGRALISLYDVASIKWVAEYFKMAGACTDSALGKVVECSSWKLQTIGVASEYRRRGIGRLLVNTIIPKAALTNTPMYVECMSETNLPFYRSVGFKAMPVEGRDECRQDLTDVKGERFSYWVLFLGDPASILGKA
ncbi:hypothetical protein K438DRAFT_1929769 [Mycena galopus ATCC 62051]|nr:hypothetical protein K438DRAFT_1929769 [Mycena galopus ATCC 62051]